MLALWKKKGAVTADSPCNCSAESRDCRARSTLHVTVVTCTRRSQRFLMLYFFTSIHVSRRVPVCRNSLYLCNKNTKTTAGDIVTDINKIHVASPRRSFTPQGYRGVGKGWGIKKMLWNASMSPRGLQVQRKGINPHLARAYHCHVHPEAWRCLGLW